MEREIKQMTAVHSRDLHKLLEKFGIKPEFDEGKLHCKFCDAIITEENIYSIYPESGNFSLICDKPECITLFFEYLDERKKKEVE